MKVVALIGILAAYLLLDSFTSSYHLDMWRKQIDINNLTHCRLMALETGQDCQGGEK